MGQESKVCNKCLENKKMSEFYPHKTTRDRYMQMCKVCKAATDHKSRLRRVYGMDVADYDALLKEQDGVCAICGEGEVVTSPKKVISLAVDHDHVTGAVRGLLCHACNTGLGKFKDDQELLNKAIHYLKAGEGDESSEHPT